MSESAECGTIDLYKLLIVLCCYRKGFVHVKHSAITVSKSFLQGTSLNWNNSRNKSDMCMCVCGSLWNMTDASVLFSPVCVCGFM